MHTDAIKQYMEQHRDAMIRDLGTLIEIPSVTSDREQVRRALLAVLELARGMGFDAKSVLDDRVGVISFGEGEETVGILAHVDVVPPGEDAEWETPPFQMIEKNGRLYGRGTLDDKGAVVASLYAMKYLKDCGAPIYKKVQMILGTQEEEEWSDIEAYVAAFPLPDYGFTPDGEFPLCNIEKGIMALELRLPLDAEDSKPVKDGWYLSRLSAGSAINTVPGTCSALIRRFENGAAAEEKTVKAAGKSVHSCQPEKGTNAVFVMADTLKEYGLQENRLWYLLRELQRCFGDIYGKAIGLYSADEYYNGEFVHRNCFSPNVISVEDGELKVMIDVRFAYGSEESEITDRLNELAGSLGGRLRVEFQKPAVYVSKDRPFMSAFGEAYEEASGKKHEFVLAYGGSYAKAMPNIVSWGPIFPGEEDTCHEPNEYIAVDTLLDNSKIFAGALAKVALSQQSFR